MRNIFQMIIALSYFCMSSPHAFAISNPEICMRDSFVCLETIGSDAFYNEKSKFQTIRLDLSAAHNNTNGNYVSVVLHNLTTGATDWRSNRIQTLAKSVGFQIRDDASADVDITKIGKLVPGSDNLYEYTFSSEMEIVSIDGYVDKSMVWLKLKSSIGMTAKPSEKPSMKPSEKPSEKPSIKLSVKKSVNPSADSFTNPSANPSAEPSVKPLLQCPDDKHPHMIDLGLPSGTKWACCNVGADKPEGYGNLYAWGETDTKTDYCQSSYKHAQKTNSQHGIWDFHHDTDFWTVKSIGKSISGLNYDVAHVKWGGGWKMPTLEQFKELISNCSFECRMVNGVFCGVFTGANGGSIFLPASGAYMKSAIEYRGDTGFYWSDSSDPNDIYNARYLYFDEEGASISNHGRERGHSVRPVCK